MREEGMQMLSNGKGKTCLAYTRRSCQGKKTRLLLHQPIAYFFNLTLATEAGATILPAAPGFYHRPARVEQLVDFIVQRVLDHLGIDIAVAPRWRE